MLTCVALGWLAYWLWSSTPTIWPEAADRGAPAIALEQAQISKHDVDGKKLWELEARSMEAREAESVAQDVTLRFFDAEGRETLVVRAPQARLQNRTGDLELIGTVNATGSEFSFTTGNLRWDAQKKILSTESPVRVEREDFTLTGRGFEYSSETGLATVKSEARLSLRQKTDKK